MRPSEGGSHLALPGGEEIFREDTFEQRALQKKIEIQKPWGDGDSVHTCSKGKVSLGKKEREV